MTARKLAIAPPSPEIILTCTSNVLDSLKKTLGDIKLDSCGNNIYRFAPNIEHQSYPGSLTGHSSVGELLDGKSNESKRVMDFTKSQELYKLCSKSKKSGKIKILKDDFSAERARIVRDAFGDLETSLRIVVLEKDLLVDIDNLKPSSYRVSAPDHKISFTTLTEMVENVLLSPCSDKYFSEKINEQSNSTDELKKIRNLKKLDELNFPLSEGDLRELIKIRNASMHFRVITYDEMTFALDCMNKFQKWKILGGLVDTFRKAISDTLQSYRSAADVLKQSVTSVTADEPDPQR